MPLARFRVRFLAKIWIYSLLSVSGMVLPTSPSWGFWISQNRPAFWRGAKADLRSPALGWFSSYFPPQELKSLLWSKPALGGLFFAQSFFVRSFTAAAVAFGENAF